jgi:hypothetical protein
VNFAINEEFLPAHGPDDLAPERRPTEPPVAGTPAFPASVCEWNCRFGCFDADALDPQVIT